MKAGNMNHIQMQKKLVSSSRFQNQVFLDNEVWNLYYQTFLMKIDESLSDSELYKLK